MDTLPACAAPAVPMPLRFLPEAFAAKCIVAVGGVAYLPDNFLVEVRLEYGVVSFAPDFFTGCACSVSDVAHYGLWVGGAGDLLDTAGGTAGAIVKWREQPLYAVRPIFNEFIT